jgi:hypothetical protein
MNSLIRIIRLVLCFYFAGCSFAEAGTLFQVSSSLTISDQTQLGRLNRNNIPSVWTANKVFPGTVNTSTTYHYRAITVPAATIAPAPFLHISIDDPNGAVFVSAYDTTYNSSALTSGYLGDIGSSASLDFPGFMEITLPAGHDLVLVVADVNTLNGGLGAPFNLVVDGFADTQFTEGNGLRLTGASRSSTNMVFNGTNAYVAGPLCLVSATNLNVPFFTWTPVWTNAVGGAANFTFTATNMVNPSVPDRFFSLQPQ